MFYTLGRLELNEPAYTHVKPLLLLTYLSLEGPQERRYLANLFWPESERPLNALSALVFRLKRDIPEAVGADKTTVWSKVTSDAAEFLNVTEQGLNEKALELYQGPFLKGVVVNSPPLEAWLYNTREMLSQRAYEASLCTAEDLAARGEVALATQQAEAALSLRSCTALEPDILGRTYRVLYLGKSPRANVLKAEAQEFDLDLSAYETTSVSVVSSPTDQDTLPKVSNVFVGRHDEVEKLSEQLAKPECRLLTLLGPGGVGKSRLALELAYQHTDQKLFRAGVVWVALEALISPELIPTRLADALGLTLQGKDDPLQQVISFVEDKQLLLVLDNFEHLLEGGETLKQLLGNSPTLKFLITSRVRINVSEEWVFPLAGLSYPGQADLAPDELLTYSAPELFFQRAKQTLLTLTFEAEDAVYIARLCELLDGSPLALELAAPWLRAMPLTDIVQEIENSFDLLVDTQSSSDARHKSMSVVLEHSWELLAPEEQSALAKLSVFEGGFTREAAAAVADVSLLKLTEFIDKSLLRQEGKRRYGFHPLAKQFAGEKLRQEEGLLKQVQERHAEYFLSLAETAEPELTGPEQALWLERLEENSDNFRSSIARAIEQGEAKTALKLSGSLGRFWDLRGHFAEGCSQLKKTLVLAENNSSNLSEEKIKALKWLGILLHEYSNYDVASEYLLEATEICREVGNALELTNCLNFLGLLSFWKNDYYKAESYYEESLDIARGLDSPRSIALPLGNVGLLSYIKGNFKAAERYYKESLLIAQQLGDQRSIATHFNNLGNVASIKGDYEAAGHYHKESLSIREHLGHQGGIASSLVNLGDLAYDEGDYEIARPYIEQSLAIQRELGNPIGTAGSLTSLGNVVSRQGNYLIAEGFYLESLTLNREFDHVSGTVLTLCSLGELTNRQGKNAVAIEYLEEALKLLSMHNLKFKMTSPLEELGHSMYALKRHERAVKLWARASALRAYTNQPLPPEGQPRFEETLLAAREKLGEVAFRAAWKAGEAMTLEEAITYALQD